MIWLKGSLQDELDEKEHIVSLLSNGIRYGAIDLYAASKSMGSNGKATGSPERCCVSTPVAREM